MNALLVDDELDVLEGILDGVDFEALGFENVYTAQNAVRAREILETRDVDIMVTDIEMPGGSGLDLLCWVRDSELDIVTLFCTSYADFNYAKKAVELHSFDYFLKPISYEELQEHLAAAVREAEKNRSLRRYGGRWEDVDRMGRRAFWQNLLSGGEWALEAGGYAPEDRFSLCIFSLADGAETVSPWKKYALRNVLEELYPAAGLSQEAQIPLGDGDWCTVFQEGEGAGQESLRAMCCKLCNVAQEHLSAWLNCFFKAGVYLDQAHGAYLELEDCFLDDASSRGAVYAAGEYRKRPLSYSMPQAKEWELLLRACRGEELAQQIDAHLDRLAARGELNTPYLKALRMDMLQLVCIVLKERQVSAYDLFSGQRFETLRENSSRSLDHMKRYLHYMVTAASKALEAAHQGQSVVGQVKGYIKSHYNEEITRATMASLVFLNPDYLARLFKKETGQSLGAYVQELRIHEAEKLLAETSVPVNEIALRVGYDNFSYFSHIFRERTGLTPNEYRKQYTD